MFPATTCSPCRKRQGDGEKLNKAQSLEAPERTRKVGVSMKKGGEPESLKESRDKTEKIRQGIKNVERTHTPAERQR